MNHLHNNKLILERGKRTSERFAEEHQKRLKKWGVGPNMTADEIFWNTLETYGVDIEEFARELTWVRREYGIGRIQSPQSWGKTEHKNYCPETLPSNFPHFFGQLGAMKSGFIRTEPLALGSQKYRVRMLSSINETALYIKTGQEITRVQIEGLKGAPLSTVITGVADDRIIKNVSNTTVENKTAWRLTLEKRHLKRIVEIEHDCCCPPAQCDLIRASDKREAHMISRIIASPIRDQRITRAYTTIEPWIYRSKSGDEYRHLVIKEYKKAPKGGNLGERYSTPPVPSARWDHRHDAWVIAQNPETPREIESLRQKTELLVLL